MISTRLKVYVTASNHLRLALRRYRRAPGYTTVVVLTLAAGIAPCLLVASLIDALALRPLPYPSPERLMRVFHQPLADGDSNPLSLPTFRDLRHRLLSPSSDDVTIATFEPVSVTLAVTGASDSGVERIGGAQVSDNFFDVIGVRPRVGRAFVPGEDLPGAPRVVMVSFSAWRSRLGGDPAIVGRTVQIDDQPHRVVGVVPQGLGLLADTDVWLPFNERLHGAARFDRSLDGIARLGPTVTREAAERRLADLARALYERYPEPPFRIRLVPFKASLTAAVTGPLVVLFGLVTLVLLAACANVAALAMARIVGREHEWAIRAACGSDSATLRRQVATEASWLTVAGGLLALVSAALACQLIARVLPIPIPAYLNPRLDGRMVLLCVALMVVAHAVFSALPARIAGDRGQGLILGAGHRASATQIQKRWRRRFVQLQAGVAVVLLCVAVLVARDALRLRDVTLGFDPSDVSTFRVALSPARYPTRQHTMAFYRELEERVAALSGVKSVGLASRFPSDDDTAETDAHLESGPPEHSSPYAVVTPGYFATLDIPILHGRGLRSEDDLNAVTAIVVSRAWAAIFAPDQPEPKLVGAAIRLGMGGGWGRIVGIAGDVRQSGPSVAPAPYLYAAEAQYAFRDLGLIVELADSSPSSSRAVLDVIASMDPSVAVFDTLGLAERVANSTFLHQTVLAIVLLVTGVMLALALLGLAGMVVLSINDQRHELAVRLALGAQPQSLRRRLLRRTVVDVLVSLVVGLVVTAMAWPLLARLLATPEPLPPVAFLVATVLLLGCCVAAVRWASRGLARIEPTNVLRLE